MELVKPLLVYLVDLTSEWKCNDVNEQRLSWSANLSWINHVDNYDIERQRRAFCVCANVLLRQCTNCSVNVKKMLFSAYWRNIYCSHLWVNFHQKVINKLKVMYNNVWRRLLGLPPFSSASGMFASNRVKSLGEIIRQNIYNFRCRMEQSTNELVSAICDSDRNFHSKAFRLWRKQLYTVWAFLPGLALPLFSIISI